MTATAQRNLPSGDVLLRAIAVIEVAAYPHAEWEAHMTANGAIAVSAFHSQFLPATRVYRYARHIALHTGYDEAGLAAGIALLARYAVSTGRGVTPLVLHRLLATCIQVGMKASSDRFLKNVYAAPMAGMTLPELNHLEFALADALGFRLIPTAAELCELPRRLAELHPAPTLGRVHEIMAACCHPEVAPAAFLSAATSWADQGRLERRPSSGSDRATSDASSSVRSPASSHAETSQSEWAPSGRFQCGLSVAEEASVAETR
mmetsp:Transcript_43705/g.134956  ORF Transcript_43705/g.134956 Transcript_43705/m.134956 type:complete len:262 (-) Transcript_43705:999-1784(-)